MELIKKIFSYIIILFGIAFLAVAVCAGVLFFFPEARIFKFGYVSCNNNQTIQIEKADAETIKDIVIETKGADVKITKATSDSMLGFPIKCNKVVQGFFNNEVNTVNVTKTLENGVLTITVTEPLGLIMRNESSIEIELPNYVDQQNVAIKTISGAVDCDLTLNNFTLDCSGINNDLDLSNLNVFGIMNIKNNSGRVIFNKDTVADIEINSTIGTFEFENIGTNEMTGSIHITGTNPSFKAKNVYKQINYEATSGLVKIENLHNTANIDSKSVNVTINNAGILTDNSDCNLFIRTDDGSMKIEESYFKLNLTTSQGTITSLKAHNDVEINAEYKPVEFSNANDAEHKSTKITTKSGSINATNVTSTINFVSTENSVINVEFKNDGAIIGENIITAGFNAVNVKTSYSEFKLVTQSISGKVNVDIGAIVYKNWDVIYPENYEGFKNPVSSKIEDTKIVTAYINGAATNVDEAFAVVDSLTITTTSGNISATYTMPEVKAQ